MLQQVYNRLFDLYKTDVENLCYLLLGGDEMSVIIMIAAFTELKEALPEITSNENAKSFWMVAAKRECLQYINRSQNGGSIQ